MLKIVWILVIIMGITMQNVVRKKYNEKTNDSGKYSFCAITALFALFFFAVCQSGFTTFPVSMAWYSFSFGISFAATNVFSILALLSGPMSLTALVLSCSLIIPTLYGILFLQEPVTSFFYIGLVLLLFSLALINCKTEEGSRLSVKWLIYSFFMFFGNGMCSTIQKAQQLAFDGAFKNEFMILALLIAFGVMLAAVFIKERGEIRTSLKEGWTLAAACGIMNGIVNLLVMVLSVRMSVSLLFPLVSAGGIGFTFLISRFFYREKLTKQQYIGFAAGMVSVLFLNL